MNEVKTLQEERIDTEVLVVGAGAGGMMAAISASDCGVDVVLCEKGNAKNSGGIPAGNDHFTCYIPGIHSPAARENYIRQSISTGQAEDMARRFIDLSFDVLQKWESWGVDMKINGHYEFKGQAWPGSSGELGKADRMALHFSDNKLSAKLEKQVRKRNVRIMNRVMVVELLNDNNGRVVGALGISTREPRLFVFQAKKVIINKGGVWPTRLYPVPHIIGYSMAETGTGDGVMMAYRAGADVQGADIQGTRQVSMRFGPFAGKGTWIGVVRDAEGKTIAPPYLSKPDAELGDVSAGNAEALIHTWEMGKGPVWMDPRGISKEDEQYMRRFFESESMSAFLRWADREKIDLTKTRFEFTPMQPDVGIAIRTDTHYRATVEGLYAISPGMLAHSSVGGMVVGEVAAKEAKDTKSSSLKGHRAKTLNMKRRYEEILNREGPQCADWREAQWALSQTMYCYALPPNRTENTLMAGYNQLLRLRERAQRILKAGNQHDLSHCLEVLNLIDVAELVFLSVNERKESRGMSKRKDYPFANPMLNNKLVVITQKDGRPSLRWDGLRLISR